MSTRLKKLKKQAKEEGDLVSAKYVLLRERVRIQRADQHLVVPARMAPVARSPTQPRSVLLAKQMARAPTRSLATSRLASPRPRPSSKRSLQRTKLRMPTTVQRPVPSLRILHNSLTRGTGYGLTMIDETVRLIASRGSYRGMVAKTTIQYLLLS